MRKVVNINIGENRTLEEEKKEEGCVKMDHLAPTCKREIEGKSDRTRVGGKILLLRGGSKKPMKKKGQGHGRAEPKFLR